MNYCTKCESFYQKPGTCNCFAGTQPASVVPAPYDPDSTAQPPLTWPPLTTAPWWGGATFTYYYDGNIVRGPSGHQQ